jgi:hypothetical protein
MENKENLVAEEAAENTKAIAAEGTVATPEKKYTEDEMNSRVNDILGKKVARKEAKIRKEYESNYGELLEMLKAGTGKQNVGEIKDYFKELLSKKGVDLPKKAEYSDRDIELLAKADAEEVIRGGLDEVVEEVDRLAEKGADKMTAREKAVFRVLSQHRQNAERSNELSKIGVTEEVYNSKDFQDFASKFNTSTPIKDIYDIYNKTQPKKEIKTMGSMKNTSNDGGSVKDFYSYEEAIKFTKKELDNNPELYKAIKASMAKW